MKSFVSILVLLFRTHVLTSKIEGILAASFFDPYIQFANRYAHSELCSFVG